MILCYRWFTYRLFSLEKCIFISIINVFVQNTSHVSLNAFYFSKRRRINFTFVVTPLCKKQFISASSINEMRTVTEDRCSFTDTVLKKLSDFKKVHIKVSGNVFYQIGFLILKIILHIIYNTNFWNSS